jgi:hypothetical protein
MPLLITRKQWIKVSAISATRGLGPIGKKKTSKSQEEDTMKEKGKRKLRNPPKMNNNNELREIGNQRTGSERDIGNQRTGPDRKKSGINELPGRGGTDGAAAGIDINQVVSGKDTHATSQNMA